MLPSLQPLPGDAESPWGAAGGLLPPVLVEKSTAELPKSPRFRHPARLAAWVGMELG